MILDSSSPASEMMNMTAGYDYRQGPHELCDDIHQALWPPLISVVVILL